MHWGQIKTLFILCFLLLDIYLLYLVMVKQEEADIDTKTNPEVSIEQQLESENIVIDTELPKDPDDEAFISINQRRFSEDDLEQIEKLNNQQTKVVEDKFIISIFEEPVALPEDPGEDIISSIVQNNVVYPTEYEFDSWNKDLNVLVFFQKKNDRPVYFNQNGMILVFLDNENKMIGYTQSMLGEPSVRNDKKPLIKPIRAIKVLYDNLQLGWGETVTDIEMGYHMMLPLDNGVHVLVPTWKVTVDENKNRYVNAVERFVFPVNDNEMLIDAIETTIERVRLIEDEAELKMDLIQWLNSKIQEIESE
ncbi:two-component system regulatory protein YycI [Ornithinibacillus halophilus]|uniref:Two-component signal transduction system YycFG, regulatory protein YycI n=1 Tax=Ornithinibacillus halophilus TaxID=930117 RepID=A0A1M5G0V5_9BACI|nr:two-component system regulatory protein YycI [Ornithinibacillus halophilus]SHF97349.1 Two-component signal transduction system YycFG, regulatory protein YycI [Ornithinibacillus halophilus]